MAGWFLVIAALAALSAHPSIRLSAQVAPNRSTTYLHPSDVHDARAVWVNPAGLGMLREASIYAELVVVELGAEGRLQQLNAGFNARGLAFGYQRDVFDAGERGHTYRLGFAGAADAIAAGLAVAYYRGQGARETGWDIGANYQLTPRVALAGVIANIGTPHVRGVELPAMLIPGVTLRPATTLALSAHGAITSDSVLAYGFGLAWRPMLGRWPIELLARLDTDRDLRRGAFAFGLSIGGRDRLGTVVSTPGDVSGVDAVSLYGLAAREPVAGR